MTTQWVVNYSAALTQPMINKVDLLTGCSHVDDDHADVVWRTAVNGKVDEVIGHLVRPRSSGGQSRMDELVLISCREDGSPYPPDYVSRHFIEASARAGLPRT